MGSDTEVLSKDCGTCEMRDGLWPIREAARHWLGKHREELEEVQAAVVLAQAIALGMK